jgi:hypothetical protein
LFQAVAYLLNKSQALNVIALAPRSTSRCLKRLERSEAVERLEQLEPASYSIARTMFTFAIDQTAMQALVGYNGGGRDNTLLTTRNFAPSWL